MRTWELTRAYVFLRLLSIGGIYERPADCLRTAIYADLFDATYRRPGRSGSFRQVGRSLWPR
jgi:hypothetical protein